MQNNNPSNPYGESSLTDQGDDGAKTDKLISAAKLSDAQYRMCMNEFVESMDDEECTEACCGGEGFTTDITPLVKTGQGDYEVLHEFNTPDYDRENIIDIIFGWIVFGVAVGMLVCGSIAFYEWLGAGGVK